MNAWPVGVRLLHLMVLGTLLSLIACGAGVSPTPEPFSQPFNYYGSRINGDDLANAVVGWDSTNDTCNRVICHRWRAVRSGNLKSIRPFFQWSSLRPGYALGDGGTIQIQIQSDDGTSSHFPSGTTLASIVYDHPVTTGNHFPLLTFPSPASITAGQLYHIVFTNVAVDPKANWVSLDNLFMWDASNPVQPTISNTDMAILERGCSGGWAVFNRGAGHSFTPIIELDFEDGTSQGQGYVQGYGQTVGSPWVNPKPISGIQEVRETFTVSGADRVVSSVAVRVNRSSGSGPLTIRLEKSGGTLVGQGTLAVAQGAVSSSHNGSSWAKVAFAAPLTLQGGIGYNLVLSSPAGTVHTAHVLEKGSSYGFKPTTYFADGHAEFNSGTGWKGWDLFGQPNRTDTDLQFYFE